MLFRPCCRVVEQQDGGGLFKEEKRIEQYRLMRVVRLFIWLVAILAAGSQGCEVLQMTDWAAIRRYTDNELRAQHKERECQADGG